MTVILYICPTHEQIVTFFKLIGKLGQILTSLWLVYIKECTPGHTIDFSLRLNTVVTVDLGLRLIRFLAVIETEILVIVVLVLREI